jgi:tetratricopeptide (TPR) repeat protein
MKRAIVLLVMMMLGLGSAQAADRKAGQGHARKANALAAAGKCKQAIPEFNAAYRLLGDPALLFNRAECLRKVGRPQQALYDYRKFLAEMPSAPNRSTVEGRIAVLDPAAADAPRAKHAVEISPVAAPASPITAPASPVAAPVAEAPRAGVQTASLQSASLRVPVASVTAAPLAMLPPPAPEPQPMVVARAQPAEPPSDRSAWVWMSVAVAVVAAAAGGAMFVASRPRTP